MSGFTALVLAGTRNLAGDGLNTATQLKAEMVLAGTRMIDRVIAALSASPHVTKIIVCGPHHLGTWANVTFFPPSTSPARSIAAFLESRTETGPVLITTADHALLSTAMVDHFCAQTLSMGNDLTVAMADKAMVQAAYPGTKRTGYNFRGGAWCSCNIFGVMSPNVRDVIQFWAFVEQNRKKPLRVVAAFGWLTLLGVLLRLWTVQGALKRAGKRFGITAAPVIMPWAEAAIDVDTLNDKTLVESILAKRT